VAILLAGCGSEISPAPAVNLPTVLASPVFSPASGTYTSAQAVAISDATPGVHVYYTTDGTAPTITSPVYTGSIAVSSTQTIQAIAVCSGYSNSAVSTATYTFSSQPPAATPTFSPSPGTYTAAQSVTISDTTPGAQIYFTTNGTAPATGSMLYTGPVSVSSSLTIRAIAAAPGYANSAVAIGPFTINGTSSMAEWTWMSGSSAVGAAAVYGNLGVPAPANVPSARDSSMTWTDHAGNLWLLGGEAYVPKSGITVLFNDLWQYNLASGNWTWTSGSSTTDMLGVYGTQGVAATTNTPGARISGVTWTDQSGNLWLFGGFNPDIYALVDWWFNDLWEFNPATKAWTWVSGSSLPNASGSYGAIGVASAGNVPGGRFGAVSWTDSSGNFWLFGGEGFNSTGTVHQLNDLWQFSAATRQWTWISGSAAGDAPGVYGTLGVTAPANVPGGRYGAFSWIDAAGNLWLFGGEGYNNALPSGTNWYNDLWSFNPLTREWTWVSGSNAFSSPGVYGTLGTAAPVNTPGARYFGSSWTDPSGNFWLFGGAGFDSTGRFSWVNDLWEFNPATRQWSWMSGGTGNSEPGVYGSLGKPAPTNVPGARIDSVNWVDLGGNLWLFGGIAFDANSTQGELNDLWRYQP
jgi:N-acetylneuraminic acid mutarotase